MRHRVLGCHFVCNPSPQNGCYVAAMCSLFPCCFLLPSVLQMNAFNDLAVQTIKDVKEWHLKQSQVIADCQTYGNRLRFEDFCQKSREKNKDKPTDLWFFNTYFTWPGTSLQSNEGDMLTYTNSPHICCNISAFTRASDAPTVVITPYMSFHEGGARACARVDSTNFHRNKLVTVSQWFHHDHWSHRLRCTPQDLQQIEIHRSEKRTYCSEFPR